MPGILQIQQQRIVRTSEQLLQRAFRRVAQFVLVTQLVQQRRKGVTHRLVVIHHQNLLRLMLQRGIGSGGLVRHVRLH